jgi:hypothetical protein
VEQLDAQLGLFERALAVAVQRDAALVGLERLVQAEVAMLHALHQLFELVQRMLELGDAVGVGLAVGSARLGVAGRCFGLRHGAHATAVARRNQWVGVAMAGRRRVARDCVRPAWAVAAAGWHCIEIQV